MAILEKLTFKPGEIFNRSQLFASQRQLSATGLFQSVLLTPEKVPQQESKVPIKIELEEKKKHALKFGLGFGDEDTGQNPPGVYLAQPGGRWPDSGSQRQIFLIGLPVRRKFYQSGNLRQPIRFCPPERRHASGSSGFSDQAYYTQARLERTLAANLTGYAGYGLEFARPFDIPWQTLMLLQGTEPEKIYRASYLQTGLRLTTVDSQTNPTKGELVTLDSQAAPTFLGSALQFSQAVVEARHYQALTDSGVVLAGHVKCGVIEPMQSTSQIPIYRRFFTGGADSVRGYELDYLGPRNSRQ